MALATHGQTPNKGARRLGNLTVQRRRRRGENRVTRRRRDSTDRRIIPFGTIRNQRRRLGGKRRRGGIGLKIAPPRIFLILHILDILRRRDSFRRTNDGKFGQRPRGKDVLPRNYVALNITAANNVLDVIDGVSPPRD